jgi:hypothetical protein
MQFLRDQFVIAVVAITGIVVAGMFLLHKRMDRERQTDGAMYSSYVNETSSSAIDTSVPSQGPFRVTQVLDGDTLVLDNGETVRLIGIDAP